jgi:hypothetical protein
VSSNPVFFSQLMDIRLHEIYLYYSPYGLRLPAKPNFFSKPCNTPAYEWKAILRVLPLMVEGICRIGGRDALREWAVVLADWVQHTFWTMDGAHDEVTLAVSDEKMFVFKEKCKPLSRLQASNWRFRKMHELSKFTDFFRRCGSARWFLTKRGERRHRWAKKWWVEINGKNVEKSLHQW